MLLKFEHPSGLRTKRATRVLWKLTAFCGLAMVSCGCVVHSYDPKTGTDRLWGVGYMRMRVTPVAEGVRVRASQTKTAGLNLNASAADYGISLGLESSTRLIVATNNILRLEWLSTDLFGVRAGTNLPPNLNTSSQQTLRPTQ